MAGLCSDPFVSVVSSIYDCFFLTHDGQVALVQNLRTDQNQKSSNFLRVARVELVTFVLRAYFVSPHSGNLIPNMLTHRAEFHFIVGSGGPQLLLFFQFVKFSFKLISRKLWAISMECDREIPHLLVTNYETN